VPVADRERIFEPFHTTRTDGSGLGLTVVRRLASELDWKIDVRDAPDGGAEFVLRIHAPAPEKVPA
jgi:signal transduction histidine kinase